MADLGDVGFAQALAPINRARGAFTLSKAPTNLTVHIDDALPYVGGTEVHPIQFFTSQGTSVESADVDVGGNGYCYDLDDGVYIAHQIGAGNSWEITISGTTVTIVRISFFGTLVKVYAA